MTPPVNLFARLKKAEGGPDGEALFRYRPTVPSGTGLVKMSEIGARKQRFTTKAQRTQRKARRSKGRPRGCHPWASSLLGVFLCALCALVVNPLFPWCFASRCGSLDPSQGRCQRFPQES